MCMASILFSGPTSTLSLTLTVRGQGVGEQRAVGQEMRIVSLIDDRAVIERILRHLGLWQQGVRVSPTTGPPVIVPGERIIEPCLDDPFPDYDTEPVMYANG